MKAGRASRTAELVCMGRAVADGAHSAASFSDPTAFALLSQPDRARVAALRAGVQPRGLRARIAQGYLLRQSKVMVARTVAIDEAIRGAAAPQLVILGAGLDGRAFRMPELRDTVVFEVDHPDSQRDKRARLGELQQTAREVRFVPVDFERARLDTALAAAGHDPALATTWVWEGVVMYLTPADVAATLQALARRSASGSRLIVLYHSPALLLRAVGLVLRGIGEALRSSFSADAMRALLAQHGFAVVRDDDLPALAAGLSPELAQAAKVVKHMRIAIADKSSG